MPHSTSPRRKKSRIDKAIHKELELAMGRNIRMEGVGTEQLVSKKKKTNINKKGNLSSF
jgi:hypothetical protein